MLNCKELTKEEAEEKDTGVKKSQQKESHHGIPAITKSAHFLCKLKASRMLRSRKGKRQLEFLSISQYSSKMIDRVEEFFKEHYGSVMKKCNELNSKVRKFFA